MFNNIDDERGGKMKATSLKELRKQRNLTVVEASKRLGVTQQYLIMLEKGERNPSDKLKRNMSIVYGVSPTNIFLLCNSTKCIKIS